MKTLKLRYSLATKWLAFQIIGLGLILCLVGVYQYYSIRAHAFEDIESSGRAVGQSIREMLLEEPELFNTKTLEPVLVRLETNVPDIERIMVIDQSHHIIADSKNTAVGETVTESKLLALLQERGELISFFEKDGQKYLRLSYTIEGRYDLLRKNDLVGVLTMDLHLSHGEQLIAAKLNPVMLVMAGLLFMFWAIQYALMRRGFLHWLRLLTSAAESFGKGDFSARAQVNAADELGQLARAFNQMATEVAQSDLELKTEIVERKRVEEAFRKSETRFQSAFDNAPTGITLVNLAGRFIQVNKSFCDIAGYTEEELLATDFPSITHPDDRAASREGMPRLLAGEITDWQQEKRYIHKLGHEVFALTSVSLVRDAQGEPLHFIAQVQDITERKRAETERQVIAEIVQSVITTSDLDALFKVAHHAINKILPAENCFIALHNLATDVMHCEYWVDKFDPAPAPRPFGKGFSSYVLRMGQPLMLTKEFTRRMYETGEVQKSGTDSLSWLGVPLRAHSRTIGVLVVQHYEQENAYKQRDLEFLSAVGDQLGLAIERKQIELALKTNEMQLTAAQQIAHIGNWEWDVIKKNLRWSEELFRIFGLEPRGFDPTVAEFFAQVHPEDVKLVNRAIKEALKRSVVSSFNFRIVRADQAVRVLQMNGEVGADETGRLTRLWGTIQDITEPMQVENALRQSEETNRELIENANDVIYTSDLTGAFTSLNRAGERVTGYTREEALRMNIADVIGPADAERMRDRIAKNLAGEVQPDFELEIFAKDGSRVTLDVSSRLISQDGVVVGIQGIGRDINERKRAEAELRARETQLNEAQQIAHIGSWEFDIVTGEVKWSDELWRIFALDQREFGLSIEEYLAMVHPDDRQVVKSVDEKAHKAKADFDHHYRIVQPDGAVRVIRGIGRVICNENGQVVKMTGTDQDITEQKRIESDLKLARDAALESARLKSEFLANMSHEIRTPMNGVIGMTELTLDTDLTPDQRDYLEMVKQSADSLLLIINDILDFSKIEAGKIELDDIDFDLAEVIGDTLRPLAVRADQKGLELAYHVAPGVPESLTGDPQRLRQILVNLVGNAIKFTAKGEVSIMVEKESQTDDEVWLHIQVRDTGIGVPLEKQSIIFGAFAQADGSTTRKYGGTGLGLAISSQLVKLMGGRIWVESPATSLGIDANSPGSVMHFTVCLSAAPGATSRKPVELSALKDLKVLVVDDNATNRRILQEILRHWQMKPTLVESGSAALIEMKRAIEGHEPFRLMLLDAQMPEMDGFTVVESIKQTPEFAGVAVMMLSSGAQNSQVARCRQLGIEHYLVKPVRQSELLAAIRIVLDGQLPKSNESERNIDQVLYTGKKGLHILLVEDNLINQRLALSLLQKRGHVVEIANNGREAISAFAAKPFDVVLMDVQMPEMNGFEATGLIREGEQASGAHTPIIAMTAYAMESDRERCLGAGMDAYLSKPIRANELFNTIEILTSKTHSDGGGLAADDSDQGGDEMDFSALLARTNGDPELAGELIEIFVEEWPQLLAAIREAIERSDSLALERAAHTAKGAICYFSSGSAAHDVLRLQQMAVEGDLSEAQTALTNLEASVEHINAKLQDFRGATVI